MAESPLDDTQPVQPPRTRKYKAFIDAMGRVAIGLLALQLLFNLVIYGTSVLSVVATGFTDRLRASTLPPPADVCEVTNPDYQAEAGLALSGDWPGAHEALTARIEQSPEDGCLYAWRGRAAAYMGDINAALLDLDRAVVLAPEAAAPYRFRGELFALWGSVEIGADQAVADLHRSLELMPRDAYAHYLLGRTYRLTGRCDDAVEAYGESARLDPAYADPLIERARMLVEPVCNGYENRFFVAMNDVTRAIELRPDDPILYLQRANLINSEYMWSTHRADVAHGLELAPANSELLDLRLAQLGVNGSSESIDVLTRAIAAADPCCPETLAELYAQRALLHFYEDDFAGMRVDYEQALVLAPQVDAHWEAYANAVALGDIEQALLIQQRRMEAVPDLSAKLIYIVSMFQQAGHHEEAIVLLRDQAGAQERSMVFESYLALGQTEAAFDVFRELRAAGNEHNLQTIHWFDMRLRERLGDEGAYAAWQQLVAEFPDDRYLRVQFAWAAYQTGRWAEAEASIRMAQASEPAHSEYNEVDVILFMTLLQSQGAEAAFESIRSREFPWEIDYWITGGKGASLVWAYLVIDQVEVEEKIETTISRLDTAIEDGIHPVAFYLRGRLYERLDQPLRAREDYRAFLAQYEIEDAVRADAQTRLDAIEAQAAP